MKGRITMSITWKYKIEVSDKGIFDEIADKRNVVFPKVLSDFIIETNGASPSSYKFTLENTEKVFGAVLSVNKKDTDVDLIFTALDVVKTPHIIPFGIDPFGNYICYNVKEKVVVFWNHETDTIISSQKDLTEFIYSLY